MNKEKIGFILTALGLLVGISAAAKKAPELGAFPDTTPIWLVASILAAVGVFLWRSGVKSSAQASSSNIEAGQDPVSLIKALNKQLENLSQLSLNNTAEDMLKSIEAVIQHYVLPLDGARPLIQNQFGLDKGTRILSELAISERYLNRAASAAADGHRPETLASLKTSYSRLESTIALL